MNKGYIFIVGTRAQLIKVAPTIRVFEENSLPTKFILTGQHKDTMDDLIQEFGIKTVPMQLIKDKEHSSIIALLLWMPSIFFLLLNNLRKQQESYVFVHGDTLTTLFSTLTAKLSRHKVVHLESGLTSNKVLSPFPEELIRRIVFRYTDIACCPSQQDVDNMKKYSNINILYTHGNTILDSIEYLKVGDGVDIEKNTILVSLHRFQNIYNKGRLISIVSMLIELSHSYEILFVLHPATQKKLTKYHLIDQLHNCPNIQLLPRMIYQRFLNLALSTEAVITDGGSNQEELAFFGHPTILLRDATERQDGLGVNAILINNPLKVLEYILLKKHLSLRFPKKTLDISPSLEVMRYFDMESLK